MTKYGNMGQMLAKLKREKQYADLRKVLDELDEAKAEFYAAKARMGLKPSDPIPAKYRVFS